MFKNMFILLDSIHEISNGLTEHLKSQMHTIHLQKKDYLLKSNQICRNIYFVEKGLLACYYEKHDEQVTSWFMKENDIIISVKSFYSQTPSYETIIALEETILHGMSYKNLMKTYTLFPEFNIIGRELTTKYYILSDERLYYMRKERAKDRYLFLLDKHPDIIKRAPLKYIASYLGITIETLSRIRAGI